MPTNEERRNIAHAVRRIAENNPQGIVDFLLSKKLMLEYSEEYVGGVFTKESVLHLADIIEPEPERTCEWHQDENGLYHTSCGEIYETIAGTREENGIMFCPYCGREVVD